MMTSYPDSVAGGVMPPGLFIREVPNMIESIRRTDRPMLKLVKPGGTHDKLKWEFGSGDLISRDTTITAAITTTQTQIPVADGDLWQKWFIGRLPSTGEQILCKDPAFGTDTILVERNWPTGGAGVATAGAVELQILGPAIPEGADAVDSPIALGEVDFTYPQIFEYTWKYSHRGRKVPNYEVQTDQFKHQAKKKAKEAAGDLNRFLLSGLRDPGTGDGTRPSTMGGLRQFTNVYTQDLSTAPLTWEDIMVLAQDVWGDVGEEGMGKTLMGGLFMKQVFNSFFQGSRITGGKDKSISLTWSEVETDLGTLRFVLNRECDDSELFLWNSEDASLDKFEGGNWTTGLYSTQGWYDRGFLRGDFGGLFQAARRRARWYNASTNPADYDNLYRPV
jgi:hypothetical protein